jgi:hypothetical protein
VTEAPGLAGFQDEVASRLGSYIKRAEQALMAEKREPSALHQRVLSTQLTATGTSVVRKADHAAKNVEERLSAQFTADERDQLKGLLDRVVTTLHGRKAAAQKSAETLYSENSAQPSVNLTHEFLGGVADRTFNFGLVEG